jgi:hypothetical protein
LSSGRGYKLSVVLYIAAYALPAAAAWGILSIALWLLNGFSLFISLLAWVYALGFGLFEVLGLPMRTPGFSWQVPAPWIKGRSAAVQTLIWGTLLGPGLVTRNPYAGIWLLPLLLALNQNALTAIGIGLAVGLAHGGARAFGIISNRTCIRDPDAHIFILGNQWYWKYLDGLALLLAAGALAAYMLSLLGNRF